MFMKASYILLSVASLGLLLVEAPHGALLTSTPERGKVERKDHPGPPGSAPGSGQTRTVRSAYFVFIGGYHGGK